jgi:hypothetical protein
MFQTIKQTQQIQHKTKLCCPLSCIELHTHVVDIVGENKNYDFIKSILAPNGIELQVSVGV